METRKEQRDHLLKRIDMFKAELAKTTNSHRKAELKLKIRTDEKTLKLLSFPSF